MHALNKKMRSNNTTKLLPYCPRYGGSAIARRDNAQTNKCATPAPIRW